MLDFSDTRKITDIFIFAKTTWRESPLSATHNNQWHVAFFQLGLSLLVLLSVGVAQGRSPRPLGTFATAVSDEKKEDAAEEAFSPEQGKQMESIKSIMKAATQEVNIDHNLLRQIFL